MNLQRFHPLIRDWFNQRFDGPTEAQAKGWPAIAEGKHTLIAAPTGSGKTLAAFLTCLDNLVKDGLDGGLPESTQVVYVSPLKALSNDIHRNLSVPLQEIGEMAERNGTPLPEIRVAVRTGDTSPSQRQAMAKQPPHILITTPESLYILLTSKSGRQSLRQVKSLILDELHAVADDKRGSHLSISVERLCNLASGPVTRIGLSATQRPIEELAGFLVGAGEIDAEGKPSCLIVDTGHAREMDLAIDLTDDELGPIASHELWGRVLDKIAGEVKSHTTTLVFVNTRRLVERVAHLLSERLGEESVAAHHGSLSQKTRHDAEKRLKEGDIKVCVATASLELGIDIGSIDLVCQIGSPRSIGLLLQRVGRSGHSLTGLPKGRLFPLTRDELLECMALVRGFNRGNLDRLAIPPWPLDVLAQQIVAECASQDWDEDALYNLCRRAYPYQNLPRERFNQVVEMLSYGVAPREGRRNAYLHRDAVNRKLKARRGARLASLTSGGAIPENADYDVIAEPDNTFVGTVNEDFAIESMRGDVFLLGNTPWRILRVESGRLRVEDAQGAAPSIPFWIGEAPGRTSELSDEVSDLREELYQRSQDGKGVQWLVSQGFSREVAEQASAYIVEGMRVLGSVPTKKRIVAERFFDEAGGMQLVIHAPFGSHVNKAWGMSLRKEICRTFDFELQASATEDGINLSLGPSMTFPIDNVFKYISSRKAQEVLEQAILQAPLFGIRWRWDATRALAILRFAGGKKVPPPFQRMRSEDLLAAVFPEQVACQDNAMPGDIEIPDHPLVFETMRDALNEAMDVQGMCRVLEGIEKGSIEVFARDTVQPSVFSHQILNAMPYAFLDDVPLEERRSRAVVLRRALPEDSRDLGTLDASAIENSSQDAWPVVRDADELHDALLTLGILPERDIGRGANLVEKDGWLDWFNELVGEGRALKALYGNGRMAWIARENVPLVSAAFPEARFDPTLNGALAETEPPGQDEAELILVRNRVECSGPFTPAGMAEALGMRKGAVDIALAHLEATGGVLRGYFTPGLEDEEFCDRRILARIHKDTITRLRREIEPVSSAEFMRFLFRWQHASASWRARGEDGLLEVIEQLQGFEASASSWESDILPSRMETYLPSTLDNLCLAGEVVWGRFSRRPADGQAPLARTPLSRSGTVSLGLREALPWLLHEMPPDGYLVTGAAADVKDFLSSYGASFVPDIIAGTKRMPSEVENALWQLVAAGLVTADGFNALRGLVSGAAKRVKRSSRFKRRSRAGRPSASRWSLLQTHYAPDNAVEERAIQLLHRYGVVFPDLLAREPMAPSWRTLLQFYRRSEARGEIRGGRFVAGFIGEQFALPEAIETLRNMRRSEPDERLMAVSASDPLNLAGILTPGAKVPAVNGNRIIYRDGIPLASKQGGELHVHTELDEETRARAMDLLGLGRGISAKAGALASVP